MKKKLLLAAAGGLALTVASTSAAFAHDCFIASRSDRGSQQAATHSGSWEIAFDLYQTLTVDFGLPADCANGAVAAVKAAGLPTVIATRSNKTIGQGSNNPNLANGKGLEYFEDPTSPIGLQIETVATNYVYSNCF